MRRLRYSRDRAPTKIRCMIRVRSRPDLGLFLPPQAAASAPASSAPFSVVASTNISLWVSVPLRCRTGNFCRLFNTLAHPENEENLAPRIALPANLLTTVLLILGDSLQNANYR